MEILERRKLERLIIGRFWKLGLKLNKNYVKMNIRKVQREHILDLPSVSKRNFFLTCSTPDLLAQPLFTTRNSLISPNPTKTLSKLQEPFEKYQEAQRAMTRAKVALLKDIQEKIENHDNNGAEKLFHKSKMFIQRKAKIKENVKNHKYNSCEKLLRVKSIIEHDPSKKLFLSKDDMLNGEAVEFLNNNKRKFGGAQNAPARFRPKKKKSNEREKDFKARIASMPDLHMPEFNIFTPSSRSKFETPAEMKGLDNHLSPKVKKYISKEMKKLWPRENDKIFKDKGKILRAKIDKLQNILHQKDDIENEILKGLIPISNKMKMDEMVNQHFRKLRKKLTVFV
jgi:hypothetical protein